MRHRWGSPLHSGHGTGPSRQLQCLLGQGPYLCPIRQDCRAAAGPCERLAPRTASATLEVRGHRL
eukprot:14578996-Heterocapsa_arctica.AAC.1